MSQNDLVIKISEYTDRMWFKDVGWGTPPETSTHVERDCQRRSDAPWIKNPSETSGAPKPKL